MSVLINFNLYKTIKYPSLALFLPSLVFLSLSQTSIATEQKLNDNQTANRVSKTSSTQTVSPALNSVAETTAAAVTDKEQAPELDVDKGHVYVVTSSRHSSDQALNNQFVSLNDLSSAPTSITEMLTSQPGLSANGQPGLFQTVNIRGLARQRVQAYVNGMRIISERRAGVAASFVDPLLLSGVEVTQGPASTYYGSGAIGGTIHLVTRQQDSNWLHTGVTTDGNGKVVALGTGDDNYSASFAYRERDNGETALGEPKNNHFAQHSLTFLKHFTLGDYQLDWHLIKSNGNDIGKDNRRFPESRITNYPDEQHLLSQLTLTSDKDWTAKLYFHDQNLVTRDIRPENRINQVTTDSLDLGFSLENQWQVNELSGLYGIDYFGRRGVNSFEQETSLTTQSITGFSALENGEENEMAIFTTLNRNFESWSLHGGLRANYQSQKSDLSTQISDNYFTYFLAANKKIDNFGFNLNYGTGFRFASLSERLFSGTTGRGVTLGNSELTPEESRSLDFGVEYQNKSYGIEVSRFFNKIDNFIEEIQLDPDTSSFQNITKGTLKGWHYQLTYHPSNQISVEFSGQGVNGKNNEGAPLSDIPRKRHQLNLSYDNNNWTTRLAYIANHRKLSAADGELPIEASNVVAFKLGYRVSSDWTIQLSVNNLLNESYFNSADDLATLAAGREFSINLFTH